jgi:hypothetical protein
MRQDPTSLHFGLRQQYWLLSMNRSFESPFSKKERIVLVRELNRCGSLLENHFARIFIRNGMLQARCVTEDGFVFSSQEVVYLD